MKNIKKYFISYNSSLEDAITKMIKQGVKTLIVEKNNFLLGTLSDGDIRKLILKKIKLKKKIKNYVFKNPKCLKKSYSVASAKKILIENGFDLIPVIDEKKLIVDVITWVDLFDSNQKVFKKSIIKDIPIIIMAGGLGTRLHPFTNILPKPLLPFKSKSIVENVIDQFKDYSVKNIYISINFKADLIKAYFKEILKKNNTISFLEENKKLGTCAPIKKIKKKFENIIVTNCDSLVDLDFNDLCDFHLKSNSMMTIVSANKKNNNTLWNLQN